MLVPNPHVLDDPSEFQRNRKGMEMNAGDNRLGRCMGNLKADCAVGGVRCFHTQRGVGGPVVGEIWPSDFESWNNWATGVVLDEPVGRVLSSLGYGCWCERRQPWLKYMWRGCLGA